MNVASVAPTFSLPGTTGPGLDLTEYAAKGAPRSSLTRPIALPAERTACRRARRRRRVRVIEPSPTGSIRPDAASHLAFIEEQELPFDLLIDERIAGGARHSRAETGVE